MKKLGKTVSNNRIPIDQYFLKIASVVAERSTCLRHKVGAVAVKNKYILSTGYNGAPAGLKDCLELGCLRDGKGIKSGIQQEICRAIHAEQNVIIQAGIHGRSLEGSTVYCTHTPCILCAKMLVNAKIKRFVSSGEYEDKAFNSLFKQAGISFARISRGVRDGTRDIMGSNSCVGNRYLEPSR